MVTRSNVMPDIARAAEGDPGGDTRGLEDGSPFSINIVALASMRFTHAISYRRLTQYVSHLYALQISEGALDAMLQRAKPCFDSEVAAILARLRRSRIVCSDETSVRIDGRTHWNWGFRTIRW